MTELLIIALEINIMFFIGVYFLVRGVLRTNALEHEVQNLRHKMLMDSAKLEHEMQTLHNYTNHLRKGDDGRREDVAA